MAKSLITAVLSALRWAHWLVKCAVVYPLAMMMLLVVLVFRTGPYTFGQTLVKTVESVQQEGYVIQDCTGPKEKTAPPSVRMRQGMQHISTRAIRIIFSGSGC